MGASHGINNLKNRKYNEIMILKFNQLVRNLTFIKRCSRGIKNGKNKKSPLRGTRSQLSQLETVHKIIHRKSE